MRDNPVRLVGRMGTKRDEEIGTLRRVAPPRPLDPSAVPDPDEVEVHHVQPYQATKTYRCPGCDHEIRPGTGHEVVIPSGAPELRRHWHSACWHRAARRRPR